MHLCLRSPVILRILTRQQVLNKQLLQSLSISDGAPSCCSGIVLDKKYFGNLFLKLFGLAVTAMGSLLALSKDPTDGIEKCAPTDLQIKVVQDLFSNESCNFNITIAEILAMKRPG